MSEQRIRGTVSAWDAIQSDDLQTRIQNLEEDFERRLPKFTTIVVGDCTMRKLCGFLGVELTDTHDVPIGSGTVRFYVA